MKPLLLLLALALSLGCGGPVQSPSPSTTDSNEDAGGQDDAESGEDASPPEPDAQTGHCPSSDSPSPLPWSPAEVGPILAGTAAATLDVPIGTPLGAYTYRLKVLGAATSSPDSRQSPLATAFVSSVGVQSAPGVKALALRVGEVPLLLVKIDVGVGHELFVHALEDRLEALVEGGLQGRVLVTVSHTHSGWGAYNPSFSMHLGFDRFQPSVLENILDVAEAVSRRALMNLAPARLGVGILDGWDPDSQVYIDRRPSNDGLPGEDGQPAGPTRDERLSLVRIDREDGSPLALLTLFPIHGTIGRETNAMASIEGPGHLEIELEERMGSDVMVMHLLSSAGDAGPGGVQSVPPCTAAPCADFARMESIGELAAPTILDLHARIPTTGEASLVAMTRSIPLGRGLEVRQGALSYAPFDASTAPDGRILDGAGQVLSPIDEFNVPHGAALCGESDPLLPLGQIPGTEGLRPYGSCVEVGVAAETMAGLFEVQAPQLPLCEATQTMLTALRLGAVPLVTYSAPGATPEVSESESLLVLTVPGEPVSMWDQTIKARSPFGPERTLILGYTQDYVGYVLEPEDWLAGGFEPSLNLWGPLEGEHLMEEILSLAQRVASDLPEDREALPRVTWSLEGPQTPEPVPGLDPGTVPDALPDTLIAPGERPLEGAQPAAVVRRVVQGASFVFEGKDPLAGQTVVDLEIEREGVFEAVRSQNDRKIDSLSPEVLLSYTPDPLRPEASARHLYAVHWQAVDHLGVDLDEVAGVELGRYRFRALGPGFEVFSEPFEVTGEGVLALDLRLEEGLLVGRVGYEVEEGHRLLRVDGPSRGFVPTAGKLSLRVVSVASGAEVFLEVEAASGGELSLRLGLDLSRGVTLEVEDDLGNRASATLP